MTNAANSAAYPAREQAMVASILKRPGFRSLFEIPTLAWQELAIVAGVYAVVLGGIFLQLNGWLPYPLYVVMAALAIYASFTPLHDATHRSVSSNRWLNDALGTVSAQWLVPGATTALYRFLHLEHHRYTGDAQRDPDEAMVSAPLWRRPFIIAFIDLYWASWYIKNRQLRSQREHLKAFGTAAVNAVWHIAWLLSPWAMEFVLLLMVPQRLGMLTVGYLFASIQHPEGMLESEQPFQATRLFRGGWLMHVLMISQSQHLMHHLFPKLPYYRYNRAWKFSKQSLSAEPLVWAWPVGKRPLPLPPALQGQPQNAGTIRVELVASERIAEGIKGFTFAAVNGLLPDFEPGAHIDVHLPAKPGASPARQVIRQYSLTGLAPKGQYSIAVKNEPNGRGGSLGMHRLVVGDQLSVGLPRNLFSLQKDDAAAVLVAGGIGITPLLSMAQALHERGTEFEFHLCAQSQETAPFTDYLAQVGWRSSVRYWLGENRFDRAELPAYRAGVSLYLCGPAGFMDFVQGSAVQRGWPESAIYSERFSAIAAVDANNQPFTVELKRSGKAITVSPEQSLLDALQAEKVTIEGSCLQGLCGTCRCQVLEGEVEHRDQFFSPEEQAGGTMAACVSRAKGERLLLDL